MTTCHLDVTRRFKAKVQSAPGRYRASYTGEHPAEYAKILAGKDDRFDVEITTATEGLYQLRMHVVGTMAGTRFDVAMDATKKLIVFFDRDSDYLVDRGYTHMTYAEYIKEMAGYDVQGVLSKYSMFDKSTYVRSNTDKFINLLEVYTLSSRILSDEQLKGVAGSNVPVNAFDCGEC